MSAPTETAAPAPEVKPEETVAPATEPTPVESKPEEAAPAPVRALSRFFPFFKLTLLRRHPRKKLRLRLDSHICMLRFYI